MLNSLIRASVLTLVWSFCFRQHSFRIIGVFVASLAIAVAVLVFSWAKYSYEQTWGVPTTGGWYYWQAALAGFAFTWIKPLGSVLAGQAKFGRRVFAEGLLVGFLVGAPLAATNWALAEGGASWPGLALASGFVIGLMGALFPPGLSQPKAKVRELRGRLLKSGVRRQKLVLVY